MKTLKNLILIICLLFIFPAPAFMADAVTQGTIIINLYDENNNPYIGNWYLYKGTSNSGQLVRNGSGGEKFSFPEGVYFLEVLKKEIKYPYHMIRSDNPQTLIAGQTITYNAQYFKTAEQMANPPDLSEPAVSTETSEISETPVVEEPVSDTVITEEDTVSSDEDTESTSEDIYSRTYMGPRVTMEDVSAENSPATSGSESSDSSSAFQLAETGSPALLILILSSILGGFIVTGKRANNHNL